MPAGMTELYALRYESDAFQMKVAKSLEIIESALSENERWYVAFSGGKDSTVVFDLVAHYRPDICGVWSDDEWWPPETKDFVDRMIAQKYNIHQIQTNTIHAEWFSTHSDSSLSGIPEYGRQNGWNGAFLGLRAEENRYRRVHLAKMGALFYCEKNQQWQCNPIAWWKVEDVWTYIYGRGLDYNRAYDRLSQIGVPPDKQRIGPLACERAIGYGQLAILKRGWPDLFRRFSAKYPQANQFV